MVMKKGTHTTDERDLLKRISELELTKTEKVELKRLALLLIKRREQ